MPAHGIPEVSTVDGLTPSHRRFLTELRNSVVNLITTRVPARTPTNLIVTPVSGGNVIQFTRSDGDAYVLYASNTPNIGDAAAIQIGNATKYTDNVGAGAVKRYYWLQATKIVGTPSLPTSPVSGTTLALNTPATIPAAPPSNDSPTQDTTTGRQSPRGANDY